MKHEVVVVGGGVVGLSLACGLAQAGMRVALLESSAETPAAVAGKLDLRVSTLTPASLAWLEALGALPHIAADRMEPFESMYVWDAGSPSRVEFDAGDAGLAYLGAVTENLAIQRALETVASNHQTLRWYRPAMLRGLDRQADEVVLELDDVRLRAQLVVGADGARSTTRELVGLATTAGSFDQRAVVANFRAPAGHRSTAWQRFLPTGPLALLPLPDDRVSMVWSTTPEQAERLCRLPPAELAAEVAAAAEQRLGPLEALGPARSFELNHHHARDYVAHRVALVGDAAHAIHPLAGQGVNLGLMDAAALTEVLVDLKVRHRDLGHEAGLRRYHRWRIGHNHAMSLGMQGFDRAFRSGVLPVRGARALAFEAASRLPVLKRTFVRYAAGLHADLPAAVRDRLSF